jgi:hypothetical protein
VHREYQTITHSKIDSHGLKTKKEGCEAKLKQIESDIERLEKANYIFVDIIN